MMIFKRFKWIIARNKVIKRADKVMENVLCSSPKFEDEKSIIHFCLLIARAYRLLLIKQKHILKKFKEGK